MYTRDTDPISEQPLLGLREIGRRSGESTASPAPRDLPHLFRPRASAELPPGLPPETWSRTTSIRHAVLPKILTRLRDAQTLPTRFEIINTSSGEQCLSGAPATGEGDGNPNGHRAVLERRANRRSDGRGRPCGRPAATGECGDLVD